MIRNANSDARDGQLINKEILFSMGMEVSFCKGRSALIGMAHCGESGCRWAATETSSGKASEVQTSARNGTV
jgi:hypothetical protein